MVQTQQTYYSLTQDDLKNVGDNQKQIINNINNLQKLEQGLYTDLSNKQDMTSAQRQEIINQIKQYSIIRESLYKNLSNSYDVVQDNISLSKTNTTPSQTTEQKLSAKLAKQYITTIEEDTNILENDRNTKQKMVEVNTYYSQKYDAHGDFFKVILITFVIVFILAFLRNKSLIPSKIAHILISIVFAVSLIIIIWKIWDLSNRDNMVYDEYKQPYMLKNTDSVSNTNLDWENSLKLPGNLGCIDANCCSIGTTWDSSNNTCIVDTSTDNANTSTDNANTSTDNANTSTDNANTGMESFVNSRLTKGVFNSNLNAGTRNLSFNKSSIEPFNNSCQFASI